MSEYSVEYRSRKEQLRAEAEVRQAERAKITDAEQMKRLKLRGAEGCKEYKRLERKLND